MSFRSTVRSKLTCGLAAVMALTVVNVSGVFAAPQAVGALANNLGTVAAEDGTDWTWQNVNMDGMGWVTGVIASPVAPYTLYARTDVGGAYRFDRADNEWVQMLDFIGLSDSAGYSVESIAADPNDAGTVYAATNGVTGGEVWKSTDFGKTWAATGLAQFHVYMGGNDNYRMDTGERLMADPNNSSVLYFASRQNGLWRKIGDANWENVSGLPASNGDAGYTYVAFDANGGTATLDGQTVSGVLYTGAFLDEPDGSGSLPADTANGVYKSTDGGASFTKMGGEAATEPLRGAVNANGVFVTTNGYSSYGEILRGTRDSSDLESAASNDSVEISGLCVSTDGKSFAALCNAKGNPAYISDADGVNWTQRDMETGLTTPYQDTSWAHTERGGFVIDPADSTGKTAYAGTGFGVVKTADLTAANSGTLVWDDCTKGIGELCVNTVQTAPIIGGPDLEMGVLDMGGFVDQNRDEVPDSRLISYAPGGGLAPDGTSNGQWYGPEWGIPLDGINGFAYSYQHPSYMVYTGWHEFGYYADYAWKFGLSTDGGQTWTEESFPNTDKAAIGVGEDESAGKIAISSTNPNDIVWSPTGGCIRYSTDMGKTWHDGSAQIMQGVTNSFYADGSVLCPYESSMPFWGSVQNLAADPVNGNVFYLFTEKDGTTAEFWRSDDGGATWTMSYQGLSVPAGTQFGQDYLNMAASSDKVDSYLLPFTNVRVDPVKEGDVFLAVKPGIIDGNTDNTPDYKPLWRSTDASCTDFEKVPAVVSCLDVAFGGGDSADVPYIYIYGTVAGGSGTPGVYVSKDNCKTWTPITDDRLQFGNISGIQADMRYKGLVYIYSGGRGVIYGKGSDYSDSPSAFYRDIWDLSPYPAAADSQILTNPAFTGGTSPWATYYHGGSAIDADGNPGGYDNGYSMTVNKEAPWDGLYQDVTVTAGQTYDLSLWVKVPAGQSADDFDLGLNIAGTQITIDSGTREISSDDGWVRLQGQVTVPEDYDGGEVQFALVSHGINWGTSSNELGCDYAGVIYVADASMTKAQTVTPPPVQTGLLVNPAFSDGTKPWDTYFHDGINASNNPGDYPGGNSLLVNKAAPWDGLYQDVTVTAGETYNLSLWVKVPDGQSDDEFNLGLNIVGADGQITIDTGTKVISSLDGWVQLQGQVTVPSGYAGGEVQFALLSDGVNWGTSGNPIGCDFASVIYVADASMTQSSPVVVVTTSTTVTEAVPASTTVTEAIPASTTATEAASASTTTTEATSASTTTTEAASASTTTTEAAPASTTTTEAAPSSTTVTNAAPVSTTVTEATPASTTATNAVQVSTTATEAVTSNTTTTGSAPAATTTEIMPSSTTAETKVSETTVETVTTATATTELTPGMVTTTEATPAGTVTTSQTITVNLPANSYRTHPAAPPTAPNTAPAPNAAVTPATVNNTWSLNDFRTMAPQLADQLHNLNLFAGTGVDANGAPIYELSRPLTRIEALALVIRLMGLEEAANSYTGDNPFTDVPAWADRVAAYAFHIGIAAGVNNEHTLFASGQSVTYQEFTAFLLRVLGYSENNGDFVYDQALEKAVNVGLYTDQERNVIAVAGQYLRADAVVAMTDALRAEMKNGATTLLDKLAANNVFQEDAASNFLNAVNLLYQR